MTDINNFQKRIEYIDFAKGIGILLMVLGHLHFSYEPGEYGYSLHKIIHSFHMPMFFIISGFLYRHKSQSFLGFCKKKASTLLIPYVVFGLFHSVLYSFVHWPNEYLKHLFFINTYGLPGAGALWFLTALFLANAIYFTLESILDSNKYLLTMFVFLITLFGLVYPYDLPFSLVPACVGVGFFHIGRIIHPLFDKIDSMQKKHKVLCISVIAIVTIMSIYFGGMTDMRKSLYENRLLVFPASIGATVLIMFLGKLLCDTKALKGFTRIICTIGKNSIVFVCLNQLTIAILEELIPIFLHVNDRIFNSMLTLATMASKQRPNTYV